MRIAVLGAGAMGMLFGGYLSRNHEVWLIEIDPARVEKINQSGICIHEKEEILHFHPHVSFDSKQIGPVDLVLVFVKAMFTETALEANRELIGKDTYLMTLQNGAGHETKLLKYTDAEHVIIGSTQHNSSLLSNGVVQHGGVGKTSIGLIQGSSQILAPIAEAFTASGLECATCDNVKQQIWKKLFTNTAASSLTAVLQVPLGFIVENEFAHRVMSKLCQEAVAVAEADGVAGLELKHVIADVETVCKNAKNGYTSIYSDIQNGRRTEVDTISGSVVEKAKALGIDVPYHEMLVALIHAMEHRTLT